MTYRLHRQRGQILLIVVLISTVLLTVAVSLTQSTSRETQNTKTGENAARARAAAEAGLNAALDRNQDISGSDFGDLVGGSDLTGSAVFDTTQSSNFTTPIIQKDSQYTFYLVDYNPDTNSFAAGFDDSLQINLTSPSGSYCTDNGAEEAFATELTFIDEDSGIMGRRLIDPCDLLGTSINDETSYATAIDVGSSFNSAQMMIARIIAPDDDFSGARLNIVNSGGGLWPLQGRTVVSTAQTGDNVTKKVRLFQSHPQIPGEFFTTSY